jgi:branched-chain amino acid transport system permease protein
MANPIKKAYSPKAIICILILIGLLIIPMISGQFYTRLITRVLIFGLAAISLDLLVGYTGLVSFGHAAFLGIGMYVVGILAFNGFEAAIVAWPLAVIISATVAAVIGFVSLRTRGMYFIMITMAFAQMFYYFFSSLTQYGGDDGFAMLSRNTIGPINLNDHAIFYYVVLMGFLIVFYLSQLLVKSRFGIVLKGIKQNEKKMISLGYPVFFYKLVCFVIAGGIAGLAGAFLANNALYISPADIYWTRSGDLLVMVILGGIGSLIGPVIGAFSLLVTEEVLSAYTKHWMIILGPLLLILVLYGKKGIYGMINKER